MARAGGDARWLLAALMLSSAVSSQRRIPVGAIFDSKADTIYTAFRYAIKRYNNKEDQSLLKIDSTVDFIDTSDAFRLIYTICSQTARTIFALFGINNPKTHHVIQSFSKKLHMPFFIPTVASNSAENPVRYEINVSPSYMQAIIDLIKFNRWEKVYYVFDSDDGLFRLQEIYQFFNDSKIPLMVDVRKIENLQNSYFLLRKLDRSSLHAPKQIVLDLSTTDAYRILLDQIMDVGMNKDEYHYILGGLGVNELDLRNFTYGGVKITGFQIVNHERIIVKNFLEDWMKLDLHLWPGAGQKKVSYEVAAMYDAVETFVRALKDVYGNVFRKGNDLNHTKGVNCKADSLVTWTLGEEILKSITKVQFEGLTGKVSFDTNGLRKDFELDVMQLEYRQNLHKIGTWSREEGLKSNLTRPFVPDITSISPNSTKIMTTIEVSPFTMLKKHRNNGEPLVGNFRFEGYCIDLAAKVAKIVGFDYIIRLVADNTYGGKTGNGTWNGIMGELTRREADLAIAPLTITCLRERVVDFSKPFMKTGISIQIKKPDKQKPSVFSFMDPLSQEVWMCITFGYVGVSFVLFFVGRFSPYEWQVEDTSGGPKVSNTFTLSNTFWFSLGALMQQGSEISPRSISGRIVGTGWWFFTLIIISSYTANLAAFLTVERLLPPIKSAKDLVEQMKIQYGTVNSGSTKNFFRQSRVTIYRRIWEVMSSDQSVFVNDVPSGALRVQSSKGKYAFFLESVMNDYINQRKPCNTMKVGENLDSKGYGIATPLNFELRGPINLAVLDLREKGELHKLEQKWWYDKGECGQPDKESSQKSALRLSNVSGIFHILIAGLVAAMLVALLEFLFHSKMRSRKMKLASKASHPRRRRRSSLRPPSYAEQENGGYNYSPPGQLITFEGFREGAQTEI